MSRGAKKEKYPRDDLPTGDLRGQFYIVESAVTALEQLLPSYRGPESDHEGISFLCGFETGRGTILTTAIAPRADHGRGHVRCRDEQVGEVIRIANSLGLGLIAQVHSHPGSGTGHSYGDDDMVFMPFDGMLSIVVPYYGRYRLRPIDSLGVHQFQDGRWRLMSRSSVRDGILVVPGEIDLR